jgi:hypothetical protein
MTYDEAVSIRPEWLRGQARIVVDLGEGGKPGGDPTL